MRRTIFATLAVIIVTSGTSSAWGVWVDAKVHQIRRGYHQNEMWPWPFICQDRAAAREPFAIMVDNGWRRQNLLGPHHFKADTGRLTTAGELKVHWIMTQTPPDHRTVFVERSLDGQVTAQRLAAAREYAAQVTGDGRTPMVSETHLVSEGRPAAAVDAIYVRFHESMQPPVLPVNSSSGFSQ
jgi:hypothetical protein